MALSEGLIFGACNPLLDVSTKVDAALLEKYNLKANSAILGDETHEKIYEEIKTSHNEIEYIPGGSAQNTLRTASWILKYPNVCTFMGCTGKDHFADIMKEKAKEVGLNTVYQVNETVPTGKCAVLITGSERSLVAHLGAANCFTQDHLDNENHWGFIQKAKILYVSGFFFTVSPESIMRFAKFAMESQRTFAINLSAPFICQFFKDKLLGALPYVDILFGNDDEAQNFSKHALDKETSDIKEIAKAISNMPKLNDKKRIVIITQGDKPVILAIGDEIKEIPVPNIPSDKLVDTNGAGDAFVGGFLSQYVQDKTLEKSIDCGIWVSGLIIQRSGCTFPETMDYK
jgi:adenosine kinase